MDFDFKIEANTVSHKKKFEWKIINFSKLVEQVESPHFSPIAGSPIKWKILLVFKYAIVSHGFTVYLMKVDRKAVPPLRITGTVSFKDSKGTLWKENSFNEIMKDQNRVQCWSVKTNYELPHDIKSMFTLSDDVFVVEWSMTVSGIVTSIVTSAPIFYSPEKKDLDMRNILKVVYEKNVFTDFTFHFGKEIVRAHKAILSARSPVLEKMFEHNTLEKQTNSVAIEDIEFRIFDCFIRCIYTNEIRDEIKADVDALLALYEVADKYQVSDLQKSCVDILLSEFLSVNTVLKILQIADMHHDDYFKEAAMQFFRHRFSQVTKTHEWAHFVQENVALASEIVAFVTELVNHKEPN